jgi:alpha-glucosidase
VIGSHDKTRIASKIDPRQERIAAMLLLMLPGMAVIYAGDEIGMRDVPIPSDEARDPFERQLPGFGLNRDPHRTPMRWNAMPQAGFTTGKPWLPVGDDVETCNVEIQREDKRSQLNLYRSLIGLRTAEPVLRVGGYAPAGCFGEVLAFAASAIANSSSP